MKPLLAGVAIFAVVAIAGIFIVGREPNLEPQLKRAFGSSDKLSASRCEWTDSTLGHCSFQWNGPIQSLLDLGALRESETSEVSDEGHCAKTLATGGTRMRVRPTRQISDGVSLRDVLLRDGGDGALQGCATFVRLVATN